MSLGGVCPSWLQCQPQGQLFVHCTLCRRAVLLFCLVPSCRAALDLHLYPTQLRWCCCVAFPVQLPCSTRLYWCKCNHWWLTAGWLYLHKKPWKPGTKLYTTEPWAYWKLVPVAWAF